MDKNMIIGIMIATAGLGLIIFRQRFVQDAVSFQNKAFGFHFGQRMIDLGVLLVAPFGVFLVVVGILVFTGVWK